MSQTHLRHPMDDIAKQARQGSVSAIIQILNDQLADNGVRTRAIFANGILQLLCEAATLDQLDQTTLVSRVQGILEGIQPRGIRRVNINSRIVREQQLLWLDEINRDPEKQVLWSQEIVLPRPNPIQRLWEDWQAEKIDDTRTNFTKSPSRGEREKRQFWRGILGGASLSLLLLLLGWVVADRLGMAPNLSLVGDGSPESDAPPESAASPQSSPPASAVPVSQDPFVQAVRLAEQAVADGQSAQTAAEWLDLASRWQRASDLMAQVSPSDGRYSTASSRIGLYSQNSKAALAQAERLRAASTAP
jgi:hypothetical protein